MPAAAVAYELQWFVDRLRAINRPFTRRVRAWLTRQVHAGALPAAVDLHLLHAIVFAPARELASLWLAGRVKPRPTTLATGLGDAAWAGLHALER